MAPATASARAAPCWCCTMDSTKAVMRSQSTFSSSCSPMYCCSSACTGSDSAASSSASCASACLRRPLLSRDLPSVSVASAAMRLPRLFVGASTGGGGGRAAVVAMALPALEGSRKASAESAEEGFWASPDEGAAGLP